MSVSIEKSKKRKTASKKPPAIPAYLIYEEIHGVPIYYRGYKEVIENQKKAEDIMGSSALQFVILEHLFRLFVKFFDEKRFYIGNNEAGTHLAKGVNLAVDLALFDKQVLKPEMIKNKYVEVPPLLVVEVDTKASFDHNAEPDYINLKTHLLLDFGVKKVIWIFTESKKILIAEPKPAWLTVDWDQDIELMEGHFFNIAAYLSSEGIEV